MSCRSGSIPTIATDRIVLVDVLRGLALFGVLAVNVITEFRVSIFQQFLPDSGSHSLIDAVIGSMVSLLMESKAISIFSFLFGFGLALQFDRLAATGSPKYWLTRRLIALLLLGLVHITFIWNGDILVEYAIVGLLTVPLLGLPTAVLVAILSVLLVLYAAFPYLPPVLPFPTEATLIAHVDEANRIYATGDFLQIWHFSTREIALLLPLHTFVLPRTLSLFLLGVIAWRVRIPERANVAQTSIRLWAYSALVLGLAMSASATGLLAANLGIWGPPVSQLAPIVLALGYMCLLQSIWAYPRWHGFLLYLAPLGRMAFTNYVMESLVCSLMFFGYGGAQFGKLGPAAAFVFVLVLFTLQVFLSTWWLNRFHFGPLEWVWRLLMYGRKPRMAKRRETQTGKQGDVAKQA